MFVLLLLCLVCIQRTRFTCMLQVFFSVFCGRITAPHTGLACILHHFVSVSWFRVYPDISRDEKKKGKALGSCSWALNLLWKQQVTSSSTVSLDTILHQPVILGDSLGMAMLLFSAGTETLLFIFFLDIDECKLFHNGPAGRLCLHVCVNTAGGYRCSCPAGYNVTPDGRNCKGHSWIVQHALRIPNSQLWFWPFCFCSQISTSAAAGRTTAHASSSASTRTEASSASQSSVCRYATPPTSKHLQCE